ncbi:hypothetical protein O4H48_14375 [Rhodobacteraceae bacterium G21628-S1]|nr:hypothetical protein [Rhodobacteraceae bacterium G21628-S1]
MPWKETDEHNRKLFDALSELAREKGALERLAGAINADERAQASDRARQGSKHKPRNTLIAESTLVRWQEEGLSRVSNAQSHKKRIVFEFLERSADFCTELFRPLSGLPAGLSEFAALHGEQLGSVFSSDLAHLDGVYRMFRPATHIERLSTERIQISRLKIETVGGVTRYTELQNMIDHDHPNFSLNGQDEGLVMAMTGNVILLGMNNHGFESRFYSAWLCYPRLGSGEKTRRLTGVTFTINGTQARRGHLFVASRASEPWDQIEMAIVRPPHERLTDDILDALDFGGLETLLQETHMPKSR